MDDARVLNLLTQINTWWDGNPIPQSLLKADYKRRDFHSTRKLLWDNVRPVILLRGPRQVGKTTLCGQLIQDLTTPPHLVPPRAVIYLNIENSQIISNPESIIRDSLEVYQQYVLETSFRNAEQELYVFIDEIQKVDDWASTLKYYTDTYANLNFIVTGSVSTLIENDASETLVGRITDRVMMPMKFVDVVDYQGLFDGDSDSESKPEGEEPVASSTALRRSLRDAIDAGEDAPFTTELTGFYGMNGDLQPELQACKDKYLLRGGYPGVLDLPLSDSYANLDSDLQYTVTGDLATVFGVQKPEKALQILSLIAESTTGKLNVQNVADTAGVGRDTVDRYLEYLAEFFLISRCESYRTSEYQRSGRPKFYLQDVGLYNTLMGTMDEATLQNGEAMGPIMETAIGDHARRLQFYLSEHQETEIYYWDKQGEVDFVLERAGTPLPIEVKNGRSTTADLRGMRNFLDDTDAPFGLAVNNSGEFEQDDSLDVVHLPAWLFMFLC